MEEKGVSKESMRPGSGQLTSFCQAQRNSNSNEIREILNEGSTDANSSEDQRELLCG